MNDFDAVQWLLADPYHRLCDGKKYYKYNDPLVYQELISEGVETRFSNSGIQLKIIQTHEYERGSHSANILHGVCIESDLHAVDIYCSAIGRKINRDDIGRFVKRCDVGDKIVNGEWVSRLDLISPGQYARVLDVNDKTVNLVKNRIDIATMDESGNQFETFKNDESWIFLT